MKDEDKGGERRVGKRNGEEGRVGKRNGEEGRGGKRGEGRERIKISVLRK